MILRHILKDKYLRITAALSVFVLFLAAVIFSFAGPFNEKLILHFDSYNGIDLLGGQWQIFGVLFGALAILVINFYLSNFLYPRDRFLSYLFVFSGLLFSILILTAVSVIIYVN
ncbi:MAG: hypothetical protein WC461_02545 [Candidatus Paceibacterota bacterium]